MPIAALADVYDPALALVWSDNTNGTTTPSVKDIMTRALTGFTKKQLGSVIQAQVNQLGSVCEENFLGSSPCFAAVSFEGIPAANGNQTLNYTIRADSGLRYIDVKNHKSDYERRILPLQWAIESVSSRAFNPPRLYLILHCQSIIELEIRVSPATPLEWPYTLNTNKDEINSIRLGTHTLSSDNIQLSY